MMPVVSQHGESSEGEVERRVVRVSSDELEVVYVLDGVYVKAGFEREKAAVLVASAERREQGGVERRAWLQRSTRSWSAVLRDLRDRGMGCPRLVVGDSPRHLGSASEAAEQRCWNHKIINVLDRLPKRQQESALRNIPYERAHENGQPVVSGTLIRS